MYINGKRSNPSSQKDQEDFHCPAFSTPLATLLAPFSTPVPKFPMASPTGLPALPVALVIVSPNPREAAPVTLPAIRERPPTVLPTVEVTNLAAPVAPLSELEDVTGILFLIGWEVFYCLIV